MLRSRMSRSYTSSPPKCLHRCVVGLLYLYKVCSIIQCVTSYILGPNVLLSTSSRSLSICVLHAEWNLTAWDLPALLIIREEGVLRIFIALKNHRLGRVLNPQHLGPVASTLTTTPPRGHDMSHKAVILYSPPWEPEMSRSSGNILCK
jgi:hypothetical protein